MVPVAKKSNPKQLLGYADEKQLANPRNNLVAYDAAKAESELASADAAEVKKAAEKAEADKAAQAAAGPKPSQVKKGPAK